ncbi:hypothetical protein HYH03_003937 [Edaphochlamys debaryana]|uniref:Oxidation resistance protein 1 n=1 Tax=Edaphochlamys debaryana TaxID=47281 RepID=A0A835Y8F4_9CHLO|nr:hypothetical protein HYH03_003937 [Edaphochlamys debaryana]|eukprot:KAG2498182.1 hypothetical protein HYH03_003937 [Edaphochlamys debaryana]
MLRALSAVLRPGAPPGAPPNNVSDVALSPHMVAALQVALLLSLFAVVTKFILYGTRLALRRTSFVYVPFSNEHSPDTCIVDCTHPHSRTLTHHKGQRNPKSLRHCDTSTGLVLSALKATAWRAGQAYEWCQLPRVSTNHFDVDSFLSVWCYIYRTEALQHEAVLRHMARIGDFREAFLSPELVAGHGAEDGLHNIRDGFTALKLVCWINSVERARFSAPYEARDCDAKFAWFLPRFGAVLANLESVWQEWQDEYKEVVSGFDVFCDTEPPAVERHRAVGLTVLRAPEPTLHYYSLFSHTVGYDTVLTMYGGQRYELESKYTQFVNVWSRPVWPRIDMAPLARVLNRMDERALGPQLRWSAARFTDTGPVLRLDDTARPLSKAQRYGHPYGRPMHASSVPPATMVALVVSFLEYGMQGLKPKRGGWSWDELQSLNAGIPWQVWEDTVVAQWQRGELKADPDAAGALAPGALRVPSASAAPAGAHASAFGSVELAAVIATDGPTTNGFSNGQLVPSRQNSLSAPGGAGPRIGTAMTPGGGFWEPTLSEPSAIMSIDDVRSLAGAVPARLAPGRWVLLYGSGRDGISLRTLYRKAAGRAPTLLIVREAGSGGHVFGAFASEAWKPGPRFYGTGETFVFTLAPHRVKYAWQRPRPAGPTHGVATQGSGPGGPYSARSSGGGATGPYAAANVVTSSSIASPMTNNSTARSSLETQPAAAAAAGRGGAQQANPHLPPSALAAAAAAAVVAGGACSSTAGLDFFQFSTHEGLGVGGLGAFALWLDNELLEGASYPCDTFGSPRLTGKEEFKVAAVELWQL